MFTSFLPSLRLLVVLSVLTGVVYPLATWSIAQLAFPAAANGSLIVKNGKTVGSALIGQPFDDPTYFWSRPSATSPQPYNGAASSGSNMGPHNPALAVAVAGRIKALRDADPGNSDAVPADLVTASASGLDPDISPAAAQFQLARVGQARGMPVETVRALVDRGTKGRTLGLLGEPRVNVLELNLALDGAAK